MGKSIFSPLSEEQSEWLGKLSASLTPEQINWVAGYFVGLSAQRVASSALPKEAAKQTGKRTFQYIPPPPQEKKEAKNVTILYGSRTGNGEAIAKLAEKIAKEEGFTPQLKNMDGYNLRQLKEEKNILLIVSTHGEGEPPFQAKEFYDFLHSKRAPKLEGVKFSVLALGDRSYLKFCQTGIDFDKRLEELGAQRVFDRVDCDIDFRKPALQWVNDALSTLGGSNSTKKSSPAIIADEPANSDSVAYGKHNPFGAEVLAKTFLHGRSSKRQTLHVELSLEGSGLTYEPGDSLGVVATNPPELVDNLLKTVRLSPDETIEHEKGTLSLRESLFHNYELTNITPDVLSRYVQLTDNQHIKEVLGSPETLKEFVYGKDLVDLFTLFPQDLTPSEFVGLLRPIQPRLYSISSSPLAFPDEVHLTVGVVKYKKDERTKTGLCSVFLSDRVEENESAPVFVERNPNFRLPQNPETPIIMVGAGTGIAPYRAFVQHRELSDNRGKSWLVFGNRYSESEFLYQLEWQKHLKQGTLSRLDVAFSRDAKEKVYVQHRLLEQGKLLFDWLENGAHFYVCGDMKKMAHDVHAALLQAIRTHGNRSKEAAEAYILDLQKQRRYQTDVY